MEHSNYSLKTTFTPIAKIARMYLRFIMYVGVLYIVSFVVKYLLFASVSFYERST